MKNYNKIKNNINRWYNKHIKEIKSGASFCRASNGVRIENPTPRQILGAIKREENKRAAALRELEAIANAPKVKDISIITEWVRSSTWGHNPHSTARIATESGTLTFFGKASGCGYDKYSAAATSALNDSLAVKKVICENLNKLKKAGRYPHSCNVWDCCGLPTLCTNGSGISTLRGVFEACGFKCQEDRGGKHSDYIAFTRK